MTANRQSMFRIALWTVLTLRGTQALGAAPAPPPPPPSYADLADLADSAPLVLRARPKKQVVVEPARATGLRPGWTRLYVEAKTETLIAGSGAVGVALRYLVDAQSDARGKLPALKKQPVLLFARSVATKPGELQLVAPDAQILWTAETEARLRAIIAELLAPAAPGRISTVREAIFVPGTLAGEGETQMFLATPDGAPASITVTHHPGQAASWGVAFSEVLDASARAPAPDTLAWYRLACFLPRELPAGANVSESDADRALAVEDYRFVLGQLGPCPRQRR